MMISAPREDLKDWRDGLELAASWKLPWPRSMQITKALSSLKAQGSAYSSAGFTARQLFGVDHRAGMAGALFNVSDPSNVLISGGVLMLHCGHQLLGAAITRPIPLCADNTAIPIWQCGGNHALRKIGK
jgi:hypothetical protein